MFKFFQIIVLTFMVVLPDLTVTGWTPERKEDLTWLRELCHATDEELSARVVGGWDAKVVHRYQLLLEAPVPNNPVKDETKSCGAAPLNSNYAITAADCVVDYALKPLEIVNIYGGVRETYNKYDSNLKYRWQIRNASQVIVHPGFVKDNHNIAILRVNEPFNFEDGKVQPVKLPTNSTPQEDGDAWIGGWGCTTFRNCQKNDNYNLKEAIVPLWSREKCAHAWAKAHAKGNIPTENSGYSDYYNGFKYRVCAGGNRVGACSGDDGSPLIKMEGDTPTIIGITVDYFVYMCGCEAVPATYVKVGMYVDWIKETIGEAKEETTTTTTRPSFGRGSAGNLNLNDDSGNLVYLTWFLIQSIIIN